MPEVQACTAASWALEPAPAILPDRFCDAVPPLLLPPLPPLPLVSSPHAAAVTASASAAITAARFLGLGTGDSFLDPYVGRDGPTLAHGTTKSVTPLSPCCEEAVKARRKARPRVDSRSRNACG